MNIIRYYLLPNSTTLKLCNRKYGCLEWGVGVDIASSIYMHQLYSLQRGKTPLPIKKEHPHTKLHLVVRL